MPAVIASTSHKMAAEHQHGSDGEGEQKLEGWGGSIRRSVGRSLGRSLGRLVGRHRREKIAKREKDIGLLRWSGK